MVRLSGSVIPGSFVALSRSFDCRLVCIISAGHSVTVCARLSGLVVQQYRRRLLIASNRHTAPRHFRCMAGSAHSRKFTGMFLSRFRQIFLNRRMQAPCVRGQDDIKKNSSRSKSASPRAWAASLVRNRTKVSPSNPVHGWHLFERAGSADFCGKRKPRAHVGVSALGQFCPGAPGKPRVCLCPVRPN